MLPWQAELLAVATGSCFPSHSLRCPGLHQCSETSFLFSHGANTALCTSRSSSGAEVKAPAHSLLCSSVKGASCDLKLQTPSTAQQQMGPSWVQTWAGSEPVTCSKEGHSPLPTPQTKLLDKPLALLTSQWLAVLGLNRCFHGLSPASLERQQT